MSVDVYPVGLVLHFRRMCSHLTHPVHGTTRRQSLRQDLRWLVRGIRRRSYWNGFLAEPTPFPVGLTRCGSGWAPRRARRDLARRMQQ